jgi:hypothetical protein
MFSRRQDLSTPSSSAELWLGVEAGMGEISSEKLLGFFEKFARLLNHLEDCAFAG